LAAGVESGIQGAAPFLEGIPSLVNDPPSLVNELSGLVRQILALTRDESLTAIHAIADGLASRLAGARGEQDAQADA